MTERYDKKWLLSLNEARPSIHPFYGHKVTDPVTDTCFSQWYPCRFTVDGIEYTTAEQYMMAEKARVFGDSDMRKAILEESDPKTVKKMGRLVKGFDKDIWNQEKRGIIEKGNYAKFSQNEDFKEFLLSTGDSVIVEASPTDRIWGIGLGKNNPDVHDPSKWRGQNLLGFSLMTVRDMLR